tara:strand:+ start:3879 stop:5009 length:1131 start_codon:yes stop_codon:yes gene_type:complete
MASKISVWKQNSVPYSPPSIKPMERGGVGFTNTTTAELTAIGISQYDLAGTYQGDYLKTVGEDSLISFQGKMVNAPFLESTWTMRVSGEPSFIASGGGFYNFPVGTVSATQSGFNVAYGNPITVYGPSRGGSKSLVSTDESSFTGSKDISEFTSKNTRWDTREGDIRKRIYKMTTAKNSISFIYKELLRSMIASFNDLGYINSEDNFVDVQCIHANAERAVAKLKQENNIILPIVSVAQTTSDNDATRRRNESVLVHEKHWDNDRQRAFRVLSLAPRPVNVKYQLHIWTKYLADMDQLVEQVRLKFNPEMQVPTRFSTLTKAHIESEDDVGPPIAGDKDDRIIQKTIGIVVRTYVPSPKFLVTATGQIQEFKAEMH